MTETALEFLRLLRPGGPWTLTAIVPDGKTETKTFGVEEAADLVQWLENYEGKRNLYYSVNPTTRRLSNKASKEDMLGVEFLHVDLDPREREDLTQERGRILGLLQAFIPRPTAIVDSGNGYQGLWRLEPEEKLLTHGDVAKAAELEAYNIQLGKLFGGDSTHNIDRILRLPGTTNLPNAKKLRKGRAPSPALLVGWWADRAYRLDQFTPAVRVQEGGEGIADGAPHRVRVSGDVPRVNDVQELSKWGVTEHVMALIVQGHDPVDQTRYASRSEVVFRVCCELVRKGVPDDVHYSVLTDPAFEVSRSIREKPNWQSYALRQIERAKEEVEEPALRKMNEKHAVIADIGGRCRIISEVPDPVLERTRISKQSFEDFRNRYRHQEVQVGTDRKGKPVCKQLGNYWIDHPMRRQYESLVFSPGREVEGCYNLWRGFACDALPGDGHLEFLGHVRDNICGGRADVYEYLVRWMARAVQNPAQAGEVAVVMRGKMGTGKSFFAKQFAALFGRHGMQVSNAKHLVGNFNSHLRDVVVLFADEAFYAGDKQHESILKTLITEETVVVEGKGVDAEVAPNFVHLLLAANQQWVVPAGPQERRYLVIDVDDRRMQDAAYFGGLRRQLDGGGRQNLLHFLMTLDLSNYEVRAVPATEALRDQKIQTMSPEEQWFFQKLQDGRLLLLRDGWPDRCLKDDLYRDYVDEMRDSGRNFRHTRTAFGRFLSRAMPEGWPQSRQEEGDWEEVDERGFRTRVRKRAYIYLLPKLVECRAHWDKEFGGPFPWPPGPGERSTPAAPRAEPF